VTENAKVVDYRYCKVWQKLIQQPLQQPLAKVLFLRTCHHQMLFLLTIQLCKHARTMEEKLNDYKITLNWNFITTLLF